MKLLELYLEKKEKIIKPALQELESEIQKFFYSTNIIDGGTNEDILDQKIAEFGLLDNYALIKILGQIALNTVSEEDYRDVVVVGFHEPSSLVVVANPKDTVPIVIAIEDVENKLIKDCVLHKLLGE